VGVIRCDRHHPAGFAEPGRAEISAGQPLSSDAVLSSAFEQMLHWGTPRAVRNAGID
jgi:hypothetical protein